MTVPCDWPMCLPEDEQARLSESVIADAMGEPSPFPLAGDPIHCPYWNWRKEQCEKDG